MLLLLLLLQVGEEMEHELPLSDERCNASRTQQE